MAAVAAIDRVSEVSPAGDPDLGADVLVVDPGMPAATVQARLDAIFARQERAHFTDRRHAILFKPGRYSVDVNVGFFTQVAGLGALPGDVVIDGHVHVEADWAKGMPLVNFWRGVDRRRADQRAVGRVACQRHAVASGSDRHPGSRVS